VDFNDLVDYMSKSDSNKNTDRESPLFHLRFYNTPDAPSSLFLASTETNTDLTIFVALETTNTSLRSASPLPSMKLIVRYNQLLFSADRIACLIDQLAQIVIDAGGDPDKPIGALRLLTERQLKILPDPSVDLHWGEFKGAIHEIFAANALRYPERQCVVETAISPNSPDRVFTYRDIHESSNILAHYLVTHNVIRGDVVMVYAHRGVDLVVAVMGILKAGATFSVIGKGNTFRCILIRFIDPAYPPARQNIYLTVANPAALIVIEKAGLLSPTVKHFIARELVLKAQIPSLALQQDGTLRGDGKKDIFKDQFQFKSHPPKVVIGPDSTPTLSFTSGSEGVPKGVRGRHFSLTYYFPWMAETFGLSENDRFTMLSGIAHDPIQRDSTSTRRSYVR
jgi:L-2-aminoadipate reductase